MCPAPPKSASRSDYTVPRIGLKANIFEPVDCLATYTEPYGADTNHGKGNSYSPTSVKFSIDTNDFGLTCSYRMQVGRGFARIIGGVSYQKVEGFLSRQSFLAFGNPGRGGLRVVRQRIELAHRRSLRNPGNCVAGQPRLQRCL